jgi:hypothetical protein
MAKGLAVTVGGWKEGSDDCLSQNQIDWYSLLYDWGLTSTPSLSNSEVSGGRPAPSVWLGLEFNPFLV